MNVLVAGGAGFIGSWVVEALVAAGHEVTVIDNLLSGRRENLSAVVDRIAFVEGDIRNRDCLRGLTRRPDAIVHLAFPTALCTRGLDAQFYDIATVGTANLLEIALQANAHFLYGSSISVYGRQVRTPIDESHPTVPMLVYGVNKLYGEQLCVSFGQLYGLRYSLLRYSDTYGPRDRRSSAINNFLAAARDGEAIRICGGGQQRRSYTYVADIAAATRLALENPLDNDLLNVASDEAISISELADLIKTDLAPDVPIEYVEGAVDLRQYVFSNEKFSRTLGTVSWTPLREGLRRTFESMGTCGATVASRA